VGCVMEWLSVVERNELWNRYEAGELLGSIADRLGRVPSTVSREVKINGGHRKYRATVAHRASRR
jgi:IS30 family transposase